MPRIVNLSAPVQFSLTQKNRESVQQGNFVAFTWSIQKTHITFIT